METAKYIFYYFLVSLSGPFPYLLGFFPLELQKVQYVGQRHSLIPTDLDLHSPRRNPEGPHFDTWGWIMFLCVNMLGTSCALEGCLAAYLIAPSYTSEAPHPQSVMKMSLDIRPWEAKSPWFYLLPGMIRLVLWSIL